jgi:hypothetical protein
MEWWDYIVGWFKEPIEVVPFAKGVELYTLPDGKEVQSIQVIRNADGTESVEVWAVNKPVVEPEVVATLVVR